MKISGFTMSRNATKLYYPAKQSIASILPIVDEFVVALGKSDEDDRTLEEIKSLNSDKIRIIHTVWDTEKYPRGMEHAHQTDIAKEACTGDWCFYLQADEVVHERYLDTIVEACNRYVDDKEVEGFLFKYKHFYGDYEHYNDRYGWYPREIRIVRNDPEIHSFISAQSFRRIPNFDGVSYRNKEGTHKLGVLPIDAEIYHYGWVRPPWLMQRKRKAFHTIHKGKQAAERTYKERQEYFDYGALADLAEFKETHPKVMQEVIDQFNWREYLHYEKGYKPNRELQKHETPRVRFLSFLQDTFFGGKPLPFVGYSNWKILKR